MNRALMLQKIKSNLFSRTKTDYKKTLTEFIHSLTLIVDLKQLMENLVGKLREITDIQKIFILLRDFDTHRFIAEFTEGSMAGYTLESLTFHAEDRLIQWLSTNGTPLLVSENPGVIEFLSIRERDLIHKLGIQMIIPFIVMNRVTGIVLLGHKTDDNWFKKSEIELLTILLEQSALAFENALLYKKQKNRLQKMFRTERLASIGQIAAGAAHEIRNPLTSIRSTIQYLQKKETDSEKETMLHELIGEVDRIDEIIDGLLSFSKPVKPKKEKTDLIQLIQQVLTLTASTARRAKVDIEFTPSDDQAIIEADSDQLKQVFLNVIMNAVQAMKNGGFLSILIDPIEKKPEKREPSYYCLRFRDTGPGIPEVDLEHIFDPFYTTKKEGTGLGLSISYGIIQQHGGEIEVTNHNQTGNSGTTVTVLLPAG